MQISIIFIQIALYSLIDYSSVSSLSIDRHSYGQDASRNLVKRGFGDFITSARDIAKEGILGSARVSVQAGMKLNEVACKFWDQAEVSLSGEATIKRCASGSNDGGQNRAAGDKNTLANNESKRNNKPSGNSSEPNSYDAYTSSSNDNSYSSTESSYDPYSSTDSRSNNNNVRPVLRNHKPIAVAKIQTNSTPIDSHGSDSSTPSTAKPSNVKNCVCTCPASNPNKPEYKFEASYDFPNTL